REEVVADEKQVVTSGVHLPGHLRVELRLLRHAQRPGPQQDPDALRVGAHAVGHGVLAAGCGSAVRAGRQNAPSSSAAPPKPATRATSVAVQPGGTKTPSARSTDHAPPPVQAISTPPATRLRTYS